jgi:hypothetical protein
MRRFACTGGPGARSKMRRWDNGFRERAHVGRRERTGGPHAAPFVRTCGAHIRGLVGAGAGRPGSPTLQDRHKPKRAQQAGAVGRRSGNRQKTAAELNTPPAAQRRAPRWGWVRRGWAPRHGRPGPPGRVGMVYPPPSGVRLNLRPGKLRHETPHTLHPHTADTPHPHTTAPLQPLPALWGQRNAGSLASGGGRPRRRQPNTKGLCPAADGAHMTPHPTHTPSPPHPTLPHRFSSAPHPLPVLAWVSSRRRRRRRRCRSGDAVRHCAGLHGSCGQVSQEEPVPPHLRQAAMRALFGVMIRDMRRAHGWPTRVPGASTEGLQACTAAWRLVRGAPAQPGTARAHTLAPHQRVPTPPARPHLHRLPERS